MTLPKTTEAWVELGKNFGFAGLLVCGILYFGGQWAAEQFDDHSTRVSAQIERQNKRLDAQDEFIRGELMTALSKATATAENASRVAGECAEALRCNTEVIRNLSQ